MSGAILRNMYAHCHPSQFIIIAHVFKLDAYYTEHCALILIILNVPAVNSCCCIQLFNEISFVLEQDKSFTFILKTPPASILLLKAAGVTPLTSFHSIDFHFLCLYM